MDSVLTDEDKSIVRVGGSDTATGCTSLSFWRTAQPRGLDFGISMHRLQYGNPKFSAPRSRSRIPIIDSVVP